MKTKIIIIIVLIILAALLISLKYLQPAYGPHQGIVKSGGEYNIEMKNSPQNFYTFLLDKKNNPISNKGISCEVRFVFADNTGVVKYLEPYGEDGFSLASGAPNFLSCRIYFNVLGKTISAKFENEVPIAKEN